MATDVKQGPQPLKDRQREQIRLEIINAYADLSLERGFNNFTMQDIANRVGISHRTLYRYFKNREAIVDGLNEEVAERVYAPGDDRALDRAEVLRHNYRVFGEYRRPMLVCSLMIEAGLLAAPGRAARSEYFRQLVDARASNLDETGKRQLFGLLRLVAGSTAWARLTADDIGLTDDEAGAASAWALGALVDGAMKHEGAF